MLAASTAVTGCLCGISDSDQLHEYHVADFATLFGKTAVAAAACKAGSGFAEKNNLMHFQGDSSCSSRIPQSN